VSTLNHQKMIYINFSSTGIKKIPEDISELITLGFFFAGGDASLLDRVQASWSLKFLFSLKLTRNSQRRMQH